MDLKQANAARWKNMHIPASRGKVFESVAKRILSNKARYQKVEAKTGVPWQVIGVIHYREGNCNFDTYLGNGQSIYHVTSIVPKGRGPFATWEDGAIDALMTAPPRAGLNKDWSIGPTLAKLEEYNGLGYAARGIPSPYIWAGTDQYVRGKFVADHQFDPNHIDMQLGCAGLLKYLGYLKPSVPGRGTAITMGLGGLAAWLSAKYEMLSSFVINHWIALAIAGLAIGVAIDLYIEYKKRKNK